MDAARTEMYWLIKSNDNVLLLDGEAVTVGVGAGDCVGADVGMAVGLGVGKGVAVGTGEGAFTVTV